MRVNQSTNDAKENEIIRMNRKIFSRMSMDKLKRNIIIVKLFILQIPRRLGVCGKVH